MKKILFLNIVILLISGCEWITGNNDEDPEGDPEIYLIQETVGSSGAFLESQEIQIAIPAGCFNENKEVTVVFDDQHDSDVGDNKTTEVFKITGIPEDFKESIKISIQYSGTLSEESFLAVGTDLFMIEFEDTVTSYHLYDAVDSIGYLVASVTPLPEEDDSETVKKGAKAAEAIPMIIMGITKMKSHESEFFTIKHPFMPDKSAVINLANYLDAAVDTFHQMGLLSKEGLISLIQYEDKPDITILDYTPLHLGGYYMSMPKLGLLTEALPPSMIYHRFKNLLKVDCNMSIHTLQGLAENELRSYAFIWIYRLSCFFFYGNHMDWFTYGTAMWIKEKYQGYPDYSRAMFSEVGMSPFKGIQNGLDLYPTGDIRPCRLGGEISKQQLNHGHGMVPLFKYLDKKYPQDKTLYKRMIGNILASSTQSPLEGFVDAITDAEYIWWPGFYKEFLSGNLYDIPAEDFLNTLGSLDQISFYDEKDTTYYNDEHYEDLSARLFSVNFPFPKFERNAELNLKVGPPSLNLDYVTAMAFGLKNNKMEYFDHSPNLTITHLKELKDNDYDKIAVVVVNSSNEPPYNEGLNITLDTRLIPAPLDFNWVIIKVKSKTTFNYSDGTSSDGTFRYLDGELRSGELKNNKFTATWSEPYSNGTSSGTIELVFDPDHIPKVITSFTVNETKKLTDTKTYFISGEGIELVGYQESADYITFYRTGSDACTYISSISEVYSGSDGYGYTTGDTHTCDDNSYLDIRIGVQ